MITRRQLNIIANLANQDSDGAARSAMIKLALALFPEDEARIRDAYENHPINLRWDEYRMSKDRSSFLLPENV